ncbi:uncharacterized protein LOC141618334 [Silene latifolia]|uniref:uncharacterized protein LOC141618334 n=1 Tax=Silene latifolia TaxID=37657 RepID=UPI003D787E74
MTNKKSNTFHPALAVTNIRNSVTITLGMDNDQYPLWVALFTNHAKSNRVLHHIIQPKRGGPKAPETAEDMEMWEVLDATVLQWICATVTIDLLETIVEAESTAMECWNRLRNIFLDNQNTRAVTLDQEFSHTSMSDFPTVAAYCQRLKSLADQLKNVGAPVTNNRLVLQLVSGLTEAYNGVGKIIRQANPLPQFYSARSMLALEEASIAKSAATTASQAMYAKNSGDGSSILGPPPASSQGKGKNNRTNKKKGKQGKGAGSGSRGSNSGSFGGGNTAAPTPSSVPKKDLGPKTGYGGWPLQQSPWAYPPCPYPTAAWPRPVGAPRPPFQPRQQAYTAENSPTPTDIEAAMYTLGISPHDPRWFMDTRATSHMTSDVGTLSSFVNLSIKNGIIVGSGQTIPINGYGNSKLPIRNKSFALKNVLHVPQLVKNLVSVRKFTKDNSVTVEFDPLGFCVKDYKTGRRLMRCDSQGDLYPVVPSPIPLHQASYFIALHPSVWHARLGHPGSPIFDSLRINHLISCNGISKQFVCPSCSIGKAVKLPQSITKTIMPFDIIHCDLWTSPV